MRYKGRRQRNISQHNGKSRASGFFFFLLCCFRCSVDSDHGRPRGLEGGFATVGTSAGLTITPDSEWFAELCF